MVNFILISYGPPQNLWGKALLTVNYILNGVSHKKFGFIPFMTWKDTSVGSIIKSTQTLDKKD